MRRWLSALVALVTAVVTLTASPAASAVPLNCVNALWRMCVWSGPMHTGGVHGVLILSSLPGCYTIPSSLSYEAALEYPVTLYSSSDCTGQFHSVSTGYSWGDIGFSARSYLNQP
jgi:hypothetical protein